MPPKSLSLFLLETLLWLPLCFALWAYGGTVLTWPVLWLSAPLLGLVPGVESVIQNGVLLEVSTQFQPTLQHPGLAPEQVTTLSLSLNAALFGYGLPFFAALHFAAPSPWGGKLKQLLWVWLLVLLPVQVFGLLLSLLKTLALQTEPAIAMQVISSDWGREAVALGFQFATLVLPPTLPVLAWLALHWDYVETLLPRQADQPPSPDDLTGAPR